MNMSVLYLKCFVRYKISIFYCNIRFYWSGKYIFVFKLLFIFTSFVSRWQHALTQKYVVFINQPIFTLSLTPTSVSRLPQLFWILRLHFTAKEIILLNWILSTLQRAKIASPKTKEKTDTIIIMCNACNENQKKRSHKKKIIIWKLNKYNPSRIEHNVPWYSS